MATGFRLADPREYRRGVILGLTLAEIMILLVFLLLLSSGALLARRSRELDALEVKLARYESMLEPALARMRAQGHEIRDTDDLVARLERADVADKLTQELDEARSALAKAQTAADTAAREAAKLRSQLASALEETRALTAKAAADDVLGAMLAKATANGKSDSERLKDVLDRAIRQAATDRTVTGQNEQMRTELKRLKGNGSGMPFCWTTLDGRPIYILRVDLHDDGVVVQEVDPRPRPDDHVWSLLNDVPRGTTIPVVTMLEAAAPLQAQAAAERCRYGLLVYDETARTNKPGYKSLMGHLWMAFNLHEIH